jgi:hypothetical protein
MLEQKRQNNYRVSIFMCWLISLLLVSCHRHYQIDGDEEIDYEGISLFLKNSPEFIRYANLGVKEGFEYSHFRYSFCEYFFAFSDELETEGKHGLSKKCAQFDWENNERASVFSPRLKNMNDKNNWQYRISFSQQEDDLLIVSIIPNEKDKLFYQTFLSLVKYDKETNNFKVLSSTVVEN